MQLSDLIAFLSFIISVIALFYAWGESKESKLAQIAIKKGELQMHILDLIFEWKIKKGELEREHQAYNPNFKVTNLCQESYNSIEDLYLKMITVTEKAIESLDARQEYISFISIEKTNERALIDFHSKVQLMHKDSLFNIEQEKNKIAQIITEIKEIPT